MILRGSADDINEVRTVLRLIDVPRPRSYTDESLFAAQKQVLEAFERMCESADAASAI